MKFSPKIVNILVRGGVGVLPTDTIYGIVGSALNKKTVARIYSLRRRNLKKPMILLISSIRDIELFDIRLNSKTKKMLARVWPGKVSVILEIKNEQVTRRFKYLHRGVNALAFRLPKSKQLRELLMKTGPIVAPSANLEGEPAAKTIREARKYFKKQVDFYEDRGTLSSKSSTLIRFKSGKFEILRQGIARIPA